MKIFILLLVPITLLFAQDTTKSEAFKRDLPKGRSSLHQPKYPSYPLLTGFVIQQEANNGDPFAQHELGIRLLFGNGYQPDTTKAIFWIRKAASQNISAARFNLAIMYYNEIGVDWNPFSAYKNFQFAAEAGMPEAQFAYGIYFTEHLVVNKDLVQAYKWFKKAADKNYQPAIESLEYLKDLGYDLIDEKEFKDDDSQYVLEKSQISSLIQQDWSFDYFDFGEDTLSSEKEKEIVENLLTENKDELKRKLGVSDLRNTETIEDTSSLGIINFAAETGSPEALFFTATASEMGIVTKRNIVDAAYKYLRAYRLGSQKAALRLLQIIKDRNIFKTLKSEVDDNNADAMYTWAGMIALGFDNSLSDMQAYELLERAAKQNNINSIIEIGLSYYSGTLVKEDRQKAIEYWKRAADLGSKEAEVRIAFANISVDKADYSDEINTLRINANQGSVLAQTALAYCYENGIGVRTRKSMAARLYRQAASRGNVTAFNSLKRMYDELRPEEEEFNIY